MSTGVQIQCCLAAPSRRPRPQGQCRARPALRTFGQGRAGGLAAAPFTRALIGRRRGGRASAERTQSSVRSRGCTVGMGTRCPPRLGGLVSHTHGACEGEQDRLFSREDQQITNLRVGDSKGRAAYMMDGRGDFWLLRPGLPIDRAVGKVFSWNHWSREIETLNLHSVTIACCGGRVVLRCIRGCVCRRVA